MKPRVRVYDYTQRYFSDDHGHQTQADGGNSQRICGIGYARQMQLHDKSAEYVFVWVDATDTGGTVSKTPPYIHLHFIVVPKDRPVYFHYGLDSMLHVDWREYLKWFQTQDVGENS